MNASPNSECPVYLAGLRAREGWDLEIEKLVHAEHLAAARRKQLEGRRVLRVVVA